MTVLRTNSRSGLLTGLAIEILSWTTAAQTTSPAEAQPPATGLRNLTGDDACRAEALNKTAEAALKADRWGKAIAEPEKRQD